MRLVRIGLLAGWVVSMVGVGVGCQNKLAEENRQFREQNRELQAKLDERNALSQQPPPLGVEPIRPAEPPPRLVVAPTQPERAAPPPAPPPAADPLAGLDTSVDPVAGTTTVNFVGDALFDPGQAILKADAKANLNKVAGVLKKQWAGKTVKVQGHTDSDPIKVSKWKSNQELSVARADAVKKYLVSKGLDANKVSVQGFGADRPKSNDKAQNRRVEIVVVTR